MKFKYLISLALLAIAGTSLATSKTITFATEATYPPFESVAASGELQGFDIDVAKALCKHMKVQCKFANQPFDSLIPSLNIGKFDAVIAAMNITAERKKTVNFTEPYYIDTASFIAPKNVNFDVTPGALKNKIIGVQQGTSLESYLKATYGKNITIKSYPSEENAFSDLAAGRIDAVLGDTPLQQLWLKQHGKGGYHLLGKAISDEAYFGAGYGIAVSKTNQALLVQLNQALKAIQKDGSLQKIETKYFPKS